ncbi:MAG: hypothetical protein ABSB15_23495 [Bryobacteraceae bacterium]|jgi:hypothetical protein
MTIAAAFRCSDGIILGADTAVSGDDTKHDCKLFICTPPGNAPSCLVMAGSGLFYKIKEFADRLLVSKTFDDLMSIDDVKDAIRQVARWEWYRELVNETNDSSQRADFLFAVKDWGGNTAILHLCNYDLYPVPKFKCIGSGGSIATCLSTHLHKVNAPVEVFAPLALHIFKETKDYAEGCGGDTNMHLLINGFGEASPVTVADGPFLWGLYDLITPLVYGCINRGMPDEVFDVMLEKLGAGIKAARKSIMVNPEG